MVGHFAILLPMGNTQNDPQDGKKKAMEQADKKGRAQREELKEKQRERKTERKAEGVKAQSWAKEQIGEEEKLVEKGKQQEKAYKKRKEEDSKAYAEFQIGRA